MCEYQGQIKQEEEVCWHRWMQSTDSNEEICYYCKATRLKEK